MSRAYTASALGPGFWLRVEHFRDALSLPTNIRLGVTKVLPRVKYISHLPKVSGTAKKFYKIDTNGLYYNHITIVM